MFWKKKTKKPEGDRKPLSAPKEPRKAFRVTPDHQDPLLVNIGGRTLEVVEISSGGLSVRSSDLPAKSTQDSKFLLPDEPHEIQVQLDILRVDEDNTCHCIFKNLSAADEDSIHRYVLKRQKEDIRSHKF